MDRSSRRTLPISLGSLICCLPTVSLFAQNYYSGDPARENAISQYESRPISPETYGVGGEYGVNPAAMGPVSGWWSEPTARQLQNGSQPMPIDLETLLMSALQNSKQIRVFTDLPLIRRTSIIEADAAFDWRQFVESRWNDYNDPVGNTLTTGGPPRLETQQWTASGGLRRKNRSGGYLEASQQFGNQNSNSVFFLPNNQGTARLNVSYTQPLMRGSGYVYNTSMVVLAQIDAEVSTDEFLRQLQSHLLEITRAYWSLYLERASLVQKQVLYKRAEETLAEIEAREGVDTVASQVARVRSAVASRRADLIRCQTAVRNAQERILALVNDPTMANTAGLELIPTDRPTSDHIPVDMPTSISTALRQRPEVSQALKQVQASAVRVGMSRNELLPQLDLILQGYVAGLRGNTNIGNAFTDQFSVGQPSYSVGLNYEIPVCNRAARARLERRQLELRQLQNQFDTTVETLLLEVKTSVREVETAFQEMYAKHQAMTASEQQLAYLQERWKHLPGADRGTGLYLEDLLKAQQNLTDAEFDFLQAHTTYNLSLMNLKRSQGTLLNDEGITSGEICEGGLPTLILDKAGPVATGGYAPSNVVPQGYPLDQAPMTAPQNQNQQNFSAPVDGNSVAPGQPPIGTGAADGRRFGIFGNRTETRAGETLR